MAFRTIQDYYADVVNRVARSRYSTDWSAIEVKPTARTQGLVRAVSLEFEDGATLSFNEEIQLHQDGSVHRLHYSYHYEYTDEQGEPCFFRYDRDPDAALDSKGRERPDHAECHLHANKEEPRFKTHATSFGEIFEFILACFYVSSS